MLQSLPMKKKTNFNMREVVKTLHTEIHNLISEQGYTFAEIEERFNQIGVKVTASTIAAYAREVALGEKNTRKSKAPTQRVNSSKQPTVEKRIEISAAESPKKPVAGTHAIATEMPENSLSLDDISADDAFALIADHNDSDGPSAYKFDDYQ
jgi:hypothetical protein